MCLGSPITQISTPVETLTWKAGAVCLCCFWQVVRHLWSLYMSGIHRHADLCSNSMSTQPAGSYCLYCFWQAVGHLWSLNVSGIPHHTYLHPSRNVSPTSWFILSVLFLTGGETSVVPTLHGLFKCICRSGANPEKTLCIRRGAMQVYHHNQWTVQSSI